MKKLRKPQSKIEFYELPVVYILNAVEIESAENQNIMIPEEITKTDYKSFRLDYLKDTLTDFNPDKENENHTIVTINGSTSSKKYTYSYEYIGSSSCW